MFIYQKVNMFYTIHPATEMQHRARIRFLKFLSSTYFYRNRLVKEIVSAVAMQLKTAVTRKSSAISLKTQIEGRLLPESAVAPYRIIMHTK